VKKILSKNILFKDMSENETEKALAIFSAVEKRFSKGEIITPAGTRMNRFGLILSGTVQVSFSDIDGNSVHRSR
jgi:CRP-like cAMP-binding protein